MTSAAEQDPLAATGPLTDAERQELYALERAQYPTETINDFVARVTPRFADVPWHLQQVYDLFELSRYQEIFATISEPPRHGKSTSCVTGLAYRIDKDPGCLNFYATYGESLSKAMSRKCRKLARHAGVELSKEVANILEWQTPYEGGLKATSVGADVTGRGCNGGVIVVDDIVKGRKQAENKKVRDDAWDWFRDDLMSRLEPGASLFVNMTRWHEDDPIGRLMLDGLGLPWIHIVLPAVRGIDGKATDERTDPNAMALWPEGGYDLDRLAKIRLRGEHGWWSLYQQQPYPRGGGAFKLAWLAGKVLKAAPAGGRVVRKWDLAATDDDPGASWTAGAKLQRDGSRLVVQHMRRGQWSPGDRDAVIRATAESDGRSVQIWLPQDPGQAGKSQIQHFASLLNGFDVRFARESGSKMLRFDPFAAQAQAGNVYFVEGDWNGAMFAELESLWSGKSDDQADALSGAHAALLTTPEQRVGMPPIMMTRQTG